MKIAISGSLAEVTEILDRLSSPHYVEVDENDTPDDTSEPEPDLVLDAVEASKVLRKNLDKDPNYNPYPGVLTPDGGEAKVATPGAERLFGADRDTGVEQGS